MWHFNLIIKYLYLVVRQEMQLDINYFTSSIIIIRKIVIILNVKLTPLSNRILISVCDYIMLMFTFSHSKEPVILPGFILLLNFVLKYRNNIIHT